MDKVQQLYNLYLQKEIITSATTLEMFRAANADQQSALYNLGKQKDLFQTTDLSTFQTAWTGGGEPAPAVKKKVESDTMVSPSAGSSSVSPTPQPQEPTEQDYFTGAFGDVLRGFDAIVPLGIGDFIDDRSRDIAAGYYQAKSAEEANKLLMGGSKLSVEDTQKFIEANKNLQSVGESDEAREFNKIYNEEGGSVWGVVKGLAYNPSYVSEVMLRSLVGLATNTDALMTGAAAVGTGAGTGAAMGAPAGGVGALPGAAAGAAAAIPYAFGLASGVVEMGSSFAEGLTDELQGREMTKENVKAILEDPEKLQSLRNRAIARGAIIGTVDAFTGKLASKVGAKILSSSAAKSATGEATRRAVVGATAAGAGVEAVGGSTGEATARAATGQKMDTAEILLEGIGELPGGIRSTIQAKLATPVYKVNGEKVSATDVDALIETMTPEELSKTKIEIKNDYEGRETKIQDKIVTDSIKKDVKAANPELNETSLNAITELEKDLRKLEGNTTQTGKDKAADIRARIKDIQANQLEEEVAAEPAPTQKKTVVVADTIKVAPTQVRSDEEIANDIKEELASNEGTNEWAITNEEGDDVPLTGNEDLFAQQVVEALSTNPEQRTEKQSAKVRVAGKILGQRLFELFNKKADLTWAENLQPDKIYNLFFENEESVPTELAPMARETNEDGTVSIKANGGDVKKALGMEAVKQLDDNESVTFTFESLDQVPEPFRDEAERRTTTFEGREKVLGLPVGKKTSKTLYRVTMTGAEAKQYNVKAPRATTKADIFRNTANSLKSIFPNIQVMTFANAQEMKKFAEDNINQDVADAVFGINGAIINDASNNPAYILINEEASDATTMPHEAWHGILVKAFGENPELFAQFRDSISKTLRKNGFETIANDLDQFSNQKEYLESNSQAEEWLVQFGGYLTSAGLSMNNLSPKGKSLMTDIKDILNKIAVKITGQPIFLEDATPDDILDFMVSISESMARGEDLSKFFREGEGRTGGAGMRAQRPTDTNMPTERESWVKNGKEYKVGDLIDGDQLDELSGDIVGNQSGEKFILVQAPLSEFTDSREELLSLEKGYEQEEIDRLEAMKENFDKTPPIPPEGDGMHRIISAKELGHKTILMWKNIKDVAPKAKFQLPSPEVSERDEQKVNEDNLTTLDFRKFNARFQISNKKKEEFAKMLEKKRPDLKERGLIDSVIQDVEKFGEENSQNGKGNPKLEKLAMHWIYNANVILPEDGYKIVDAEKVATKNKIDPFAYDSPEALMESFRESVKERPIDPDAISSFTNKTEIPGTDIVVYDVADTKEGQADVRKAIDTNWGKDANPWCLAARIDGNLDRAWELWNDRYNAIDKKIAFKNGKLLCFQASDNPDKNTWWDRMDRPTEGIPNIKDLGEGKKQTVIYDENGRILSEGIIERITKNKIEQWHANGSKKYVANVNNEGEFNGSVKRWNDNGILSKESNYKDGVLDGVETTYWNNGQMLRSGTYENGLENGIFKEWISNGVLATESNYKNGERDGVYREWSENGILTDESEYKEGYRNGITKIFRSSDGSLSHEIQYKNGKRDGISKMFSKDGSLDGEVEYKEGKRDGVTKIYNFDGSVLEKQVYENDELLLTIPSRVKFQQPGSTDLKEVQKIALRYSMNDRGFIPREASEIALKRELDKYGYGVKRSRVTPQGYGGSLFMTKGERFFNPFTAKFSRINLGAGRLEEGNVNTIPGYDKMLEEANRVAERTANRGASYDRIMDAVMQYVKQSKVYQDANDSQREQLVRNIRSEFGKKEKPAPSVAKILGQLANIKKITISEKELLKNHFKDLARGARDAKRAFMEASADLAKSINDLASSGKISPKQVVAIINRFSKVNMFNEDAVNGFVEYMTKVFEDAEYAEKISGIRKKLSKAKDNIKSKVGVAEAVVPSLRQLFAVNPLIIPDSVFDKYVKIVDMFSASGAVLNLEDIDQTAQEVNEILDALNQEYSVAESMSIRFDNFVDKVVDKDTGKIQYAETINKMVKDGVITESEGELMKKYKSTIFPRESTTPKTDAEIEAEKKVLIDVIRSMSVNVDRLPTQDERTLADSLRRLLIPDMLKQMTAAELNNIIKLIDNINNGYMPHYGELAVERLNGKKEAVNLSEAIFEAKPLSITEAYNNLKSKFTKKGGMLEMVRSSPFFFVDQLFGNFKGKPIFNALFKKISESHAAFTSAIGRVNKKLDKAHDAVAKSFKYDANKTLESSFRMMAYMIQLEFESNPGNPQVNPASEYIKDTIKKIKESRNGLYGEAEIKMLERILNEDGDVDKDALFNSFNKAEKNAIATIREINDSLTDKATFTAAVLRGQRIEPLNNYIHLPVMMDYDPDTKFSATQNANDYNKALNPSTKAKNLQERTPGSKAINFDVFASAQKGAKATLLDYHMTAPIRTARKTLNETKSKYFYEFNKDQQDIFLAINDAFEEVVSNVLTNNFIVDSTFDAVSNEISKQGYRAILASPLRFIAELKSNIGFVMLAGRKSFMNGLKYFDVFTSEYGVDIMDNVKSKNTSRIYHGDTLSGRFIDQSILGQASGVKSVSAKSTVANKANQIYNLSLKKYKNAIELMADTLISTPDKMVMRPVWFGEFASEFKKKSGVDVDFNKIAANDEQYMRLYKEEIAAARDKADEMSVLAGATDNPFMGMVKGTVKPNQSGTTKLFNNFNTFMTRFAIYEYTTARQGVYAAMGNGSISRADGIKLLAAVTVRMTAYTMLMSVLTDALLGMMGGDDEEDEKSLLQKAGQAFASTVSGLILGRNFGNAMRNVVGYGAEYVNEKFLTDLREGDYDPYKDAITYSAIPKEGQGVEQFMLNIAGSYTPALKSAAFIGEKVLEADKKEPEAIERQQKEISIRIPLEVLGNVGMIPLYKDVKKVVMQDLYKDLRTESKRAADKKQAEKEMLQGYENREDMKRYDPKLYEETFGEGSPEYDAEQAKKDLDKEADSIERALKDEMYDYTPRKNKRKPKTASEKRMDEIKKTMKSRFKRGND